MTDTDLSPTTTTDSTLATGFGGAAPEAKAAAPTPAAQAATPHAANSASISDALPKPALPDYSAVKFDGISDDEAKGYVAVLGKHGVESKLGKPLFDDIRAEHRKQTEARVQAIYAEYDAEVAKEFAGPEGKANEDAVDLALRMAGMKDAASLKQAREDKPHVWRDPQVIRWAIAVGRWMQNASKQDNTVPGASPTAASRFADNDISSAAFAEAYSK